jgi:hypothetical protein
MYAILLAVYTWNVSGGDIAYWMASVTLFLIHLVVILFLKNRLPGLIALPFILLLIILTAEVTSKLHERNRVIKDQIPAKLR